MLVTRLVAPLLSANCHVISDAAGRCVVVDPGAGATEQIRALVAARSWTPLAVAVTHGHVDHSWAVGELADGWGVPALVHEADAYRLRDPFGTLGPLGAQLVAMGDAAGLGPAPAVPARLTAFAAPDGWVRLELGDPADPFVLRGRHLPGHTQGSTVYLVDATVAAPLGAPGSTATAGVVGPVALTGDVLFAGSIGRSDLPGGDEATMARSLAWFRELDPGTLVLPGHGPASTIGAELADNPYLPRP